MDEPKPVSVSREHFPTDLAADRRQPERMPCRLAVRVRPWAVIDPPWEEGLALDLSARGVGLWLPERFARSTFLTIAPRGPRPVPALAARVVYTVPHEGGWRTGCRFTRLLPDGVLAAWLSAGNDA